MSYPIHELTKAFFEDPRWQGVEELIKSFTDPLIDIRMIDVSKDAEDIKAQVIGRIHAYNQLNEFLNQVKILNHPKLPEDKRSPYR